MKVSNPYLLIENCHIDVIREAMALIRQGDEVPVTEEGEFEPPTAADFGLASFDDYVPHEDDDEVSHGSEVDEDGATNYVELLDLELTWDILMKSQDRIYLRFNEALTFDAAISLLRDFSKTTAVYQKGKVTVQMGIEEGDTVPLSLQNTRASISFSDEKLEAIHKDADSAYEFFPIAQLESGARYAVQDFPPMVARLAPDGKYQAPDQFSEYPVIESGELKVTWYTAPYVMAELKTE